MLLHTIWHKPESTDNSIPSKVHGCKLLTGRFKSVPVWLIQGSLSSAHLRAALMSVFCDITPKSNIRRCKMRRGACGTASSRSDEPPFVRPLSPCNAFLTNAKRNKGCLGERQTKTLATNGCFLKTWHEKKSYHHRIHLKWKLLISLTKQNVLDNVKMENKWLPLTKVNHG